MSRYNTIEWHRVDGVTELDVLHSSRQFLYNTPVLRSSLGGYLDYPVNHELGVSLSLFQAEYISRHYPELLAKQACWFVKNLCEMTDLVKCGVHLRLGITNDMESVCVPYLDACSFPMAHVDWLDPHRSGRFSKFDAMRTEGFGDIRKILHLDLNFLFGGHTTHTPTPIFSRIRELWKSKPIATAKSILQPRDSDFYQDLREYGTSDLYDEILKQVADYVGNSVDIERDYWECADPAYVFGGAAFGFARDALEGELIGELDKLMHITISDEQAVAIYMRANGYRPDDVDDIFSAFKWSAGKKEDVELYAESPTIYTTSEYTDFSVWMSQHQ